MSGISLGAQVNAEKLRWQYEVEPTWTFFVDTPTPTGAFESLGWTVLEPDQVAYLYGYQVTASIANIFWLYFSVSTDPAVPYWMGIPIVLSKPGTIVKWSKAPMGVARPTYDPTASVPLAPVIIQSQVAEPLAGNYFQVGVLMAIVNRSEV